jgi:hypothetical protein
MDLFGESLCPQFIRELPELVEIDARPEPERMGNRLWRGIMSGRGGLAQTGANCPLCRDGSIVKKIAAAGSLFYPRFEASVA